MKKLLVTCLSLSLWFLVSCYDPEDYEYTPKELLEPKVKLKLNNDSVNINKAAFAVYTLSDSKIIFGCQNKEEEKSFGCYISGVERPLFPDDLGKHTKLDLVDIIPREKMISENGRAVSFLYSLFKNDSLLHRWEGTDPPINEFVIDSVYLFEKEVYLSGSFTAEVRSFDGGQPGYSYFQGTYKDIRVTIFNQ